LFIASLFVLIFQDALIFWNAIALCYSSQSVVLQSHVPSQKTWVVCEVVVKVLSLVSSCVLNYNREHYLFAKALEFIISTCRDIHEKPTFQTIFDSHIEEDVFDYELKEFTIREKCQIF
jgi:hypothetical protein